MRVLATFSPRTTALAVALVALVTSPRAPLAKPQPVSLTIALEKSYPFWRTALVRVTLRNRGKEPILLDSIRFVSGSIELERRKSITLPAERKGDGIVTGRGPKLPLGKKDLVSTHGGFSVRRALLLRGGGTFYESWRPLFNHLAGPEVRVTVRYRPLTGGGLRLYTRVSSPAPDGKTESERYRIAVRPTSGLVVTDESDIGWFANLKSVVARAKLTLARPAYPLALARKKWSQPGKKERVGYWLARQMWAFSDGKRTELHGAKGSHRLPGDALLLLDQLNRRPAVATEVELLAGELDKKREQRFLRALRGARFEVRPATTRRGRSWRVRVDDGSLLRLVELVRAARLVFRGRTLRAG